MALDRKLREKIADALNDLDDEVVEGLVNQALHAAEEKWTNCPHCKKALRIPLPDPIKRAKALEILTNLSMGVRKAEEAAPKRPRFLAELENLTDEELAALVSEEGGT